MSVVRCYVGANDSDLACIKEAYAVIKVSDGKVSDCHVIHVIQHKPRPASITLKRVPTPINYRIVSFNSDKIVDASSESVGDIVNT